DVERLVLGPSADLLREARGLLEVVTHVRLDDERLLGPIDRSLGGRVAEALQLPPDRVGGLRPGGGLLGEEPAEEVQEAVRDANGRIREQRRRLLRDLTEQRPALRRGEAGLAEDRVVEHRSER